MNVPNGFTFNERIGMHTSLKHSNRLTPTIDDDDDGDDDDDEDDDGQRLKLGVTVEVGLGVGGMSLEIMNPWLKPQYSKR